GPSLHRPWPVPAAVQSSDIVASCPPLRVRPASKLSDSRDRFTEFDVADGPSMLFGRIAGLVIRFDGVRRGRKNGEVPPADNLGCGNGDISRDRHLDQSWRFRVERSLDICADIVLGLHFGCDFKAK